MKVSILVLNYNAKYLLEQYLASVLGAAKSSQYQCDVILVDNSSKDGSIEFIKERFPSVRLFISKKNEVLCSYNEALKSIDSEVVILLNNDIKVKEDFVDYLVGHFNRQEVFFVAPRLLNFDNSYNGGRSYLRFKFGILKNVVDSGSAALPGLTHSIATGAFRRSDFLKFGGFDRLYLPGIWEEVDICYKAMIMGKLGIYEPKSIIWHQESTTFNKEYGQRQKLILAHRNMFLFFWKNITDAGFILQHIFFLPARVLYSFFSGKTELALGFIFALPRMPRALLRRWQERQFRRLRTLRDRDIIK